MSLRKNIALFILIVVPFLSGLAGGAQLTVQAAPLASLPAGDAFGYTAGALADPIPLSVCANPSSTKIVFSGSPESFFGPISFGEFNFPFYENQYAEFWLSINGLISLTSTDLEAYEHLPIPTDIIPNNLIAPFWTDLDLPSTEPLGQVCYQNFPADGTNSQYLAVEWNNVKLNDTPGLFTVQALLFKDGDIQFQYSNGIPDVTYATVGIEDGQGIFGLQIYYNEAGLEANKTIRISRPLSHPSGRFIPTFQSSFLLQQETDLSFTLENISGYSTAYHLAVAGVPVENCTWNTFGWEIAFFDGENPISDSDGDACPDVLVSAAEKKELTARLRAPQTVQVGDYQKFALTALPADGTPPVSMTLQAAVPANFAQAFVENVLGTANIPMQLALIHENGLVKSVAGDIYSGKNLALTPAGSGGYFYAWERYYTGGSYLLGSIFNRAGEPTRYSFNITPSDELLLNQELAVGSTPDGNIAVTWVRSGTELLVGILSPSGSPLREPVHIATSAVPSSPRIAADQNNHFFVIWMQEGASQRDIYLTVLNSQGDVITPAGALTNAALTGEDYFSPAITGLQGGGAAVVYSVGTAEGIQPLAYRILQSDGAPVQIETKINYSNPHARTKDIVQLSDGKILLGWIDESTHHAHYALLSRDLSTWVAGSVHELSPDYQLGAINLSVTSDAQDHGIITWAEERGNRTLSYALVDSSGELRTPPMVFMSGVGLDTNAGGQGIAPYVPSSSVFIPLLMR